MQLADAIARIQVLEGPGKQTVIDESLNSCKAALPTPQLVSTVKDLVHTEVQTTKKEAIVSLMQR